ncbi:MAG: ATP-binding protein, partial [Proteobacteria bacterium]|nr:ATP-binding protein [Pseudomonadota bacterium]
MNIEHHIEKQLKTLRLGGFIETLDLRLKQAQQEEFDHLTFLQVMLQDEIERREAKKLTQRLSRAS